MKTKFLGLLSWKQSGSSSFSLNKFNSQANRDWAHTSCACSHWVALIRAATCLHPNLPASAHVWSSWACRAQPLPSESKNCPGADVVCARAGDKDSIKLLGQMYTGTSQDRELFSCALCWLDSKLIKLGRLLLWIRDFRSCPVHWYKSCLYGWSWVIVFEKSMRSKPGSSRVLVSLPQGVPWQRMSLPFL